MGAAPAVGARTLKVVSGGDTSLTHITILANPTIATNKIGGGAGTVVQVTGSNWDPNQTVTVSTNKAQPPPNATTDPTVTATADANGNINTSITVNDPTTGAIGASRTHAAGPPPVVIFTSVPFTFSGDSCTAKVGAAATGSCALLETVNLTITAGDLKMSKVAGDVTLSGVALDGAAQTSTGSLQDVTVKDYRGGTLGWSLVGPVLRSDRTREADDRQPHHCVECDDVDAFVHGRHQQRRHHRHRSCGCVRDLHDRPAALLGEHQLVWARTAPAAATRSLMPACPWPSAPTRRPAATPARSR